MFSDLPNVGEADPQWPVITKDVRGVYPVGRLGGCACDVRRSEAPGKAAEASAWPWGTATPTWPPRGSSTFPGPRRRAGSVSVFELSLIQPHDREPPVGQREEKVHGLEEVRCSWRRQVCKKHF